MKKLTIALLFMFSAFCFFYAFNAHAVSVYGKSLNYQVLYNDDGRLGNASPNLIRIGYPTFVAYGGARVFTVTITNKTYNPAIPFAPTVGVAIKHNHWAPSDGTGLFTEYHPSENFSVTYNCSGDLLQYLQSCTAFITFEPAENALLLPGIYSTKYEVLQLFNNGVLIRDYVLQGIYQK